jgi:hypothetical protein
MALSNFLSNHNLCPSLLNNTSFDIHLLLGIEVAATPNNTNKAKFRVIGERKAKGSSGITGLPKRKHFYRLAVDIATRAWFLTL